MELTHFFLTDSGCMKTVVVRREWQSCFGRIFQWRK